MAISIFPVASASSNTLAYTTTLTLNNTTYKAVQPLSSGVYTVTVSPTSAIARIDFFNATSSGTSVTTSAGSIVANLGTDVTYYNLSTDTAGAIVTVTRTASSISGTSLSGILDTITTTGTYNQTGTLYVLAYGGGGGGSGNNSGGGAGGGGASVPGVYFGPVNTSTSVTIGTAGTGGNSGNGNAGGTTNFGNIISSAGANGGNGSGGGTLGGGNGSPGGYTPGNSGINQFFFANQSIKSGSNGGGGGGASYHQHSAGTGGGSGIGTGGNGGGYYGSGNDATGYGAGGGGAGSPTYVGGAGSPGVVFVLRNF
jgi:hypothetical protein